MTMPARTVRVHRPNDIRVQRDDLQIQDEFDDLVVLACDGDAYAVTAIAVAFGARLRKEARLQLGRFEDDADDVLQDFFLAVVEGGACFDPEQERAGVWLRRVVREIARKHRAERERDWGIEQ
jgi:DNA-directed RNA polymerase specialized sigma24 family protein